MAPQLKEPEAMLERMFLVRHELIIARTMSAQTRDVYARITSLTRFVGEEDRAFAHDLADQFGRVASIGDGEWNFVFAVIELYQTRVNTKMTLAMERLAVIAAVTLPVTAIASVYGMNVIVNESTHYIQLVIVILVMVTISTLLLRWRTSRLVVSRRGCEAARPAVRASRRRPAGSLDDDLDPLELLELGVAGGGHRPAQRADQVHGAVGHAGGPNRISSSVPTVLELDALPRAARGGAPRAPVEAAAGRVGGARERRADHHRVGAAGDRLGDVAGLPIEPSAMTCT
jgi:hypothetical protein